MHSVSQFFAHDAVRFISGAVSCKYFLNSGPADPLRNFPDIFFRLIVQMKSADQRPHLPSRKRGGSFTDHSVRTAVGTAVKNDDSARRLKHKTLLMSKAVRDPASLFLQEHLLSPAGLLQPRRPV